MKLLIIYLTPLFITSIVSQPKHNRNSPDADPNKRRSVSGSDTGTGTGTSNPDATTQGAQQTNFFGLGGIFGSHPFHNQQEQQPPTSFGSSFPHFNLPDYTQQQQSLGSFPHYVHQGNLPGNSTQPLFTPPITPYGDYGSYHQVNPTLQGDYNQNPWPERKLNIIDSENFIELFLTPLVVFLIWIQKLPRSQTKNFVSKCHWGSGPGGSVSEHGNPTGQADYTSINYPPSFSPLPFTPQSFWGHEHDHPTPSVGEEDLNQWLEEIQQEDQTSKQGEEAAPKSQPKLRSQKERAEKIVKKLGYTPKQISFKYLTRRYLRGYCHLCQEHKYDIEFTVNNDEGVENCIMQHISSDNHQNAIKNENITTKETQTKQQTTKGHFKCL
uniref:Uncharacterized protein n=1 Tax=Meloidogyne floridensis TaxID=298350 RepID=A0A915P8X4_9BILA